MPPHTRQDASQRNPEKTQVPARTWRRQPQSPLVQTQNDAAAAENGPLVPQNIKNRTAP